MQASMTTPLATRTAPVPGQDRPRTRINPVARLRRFDGSTLPETAETSSGGCPDGTHELVRPLSLDGNSRVCTRCHCGDSALYGSPRGAAKGDFRVVCREEGCPYGDHTDAEGNGYTNHTHILLAKAALKDHQAEVEDGPHDASIQQHPVAEVVRGGS